MKTLLTFCTLVLGLVLGATAWAQNTAVTSQLSAQRVETINGKTVFKPASDGKPGEVLRYSGTYRNGGSTAVSKLLATVPVPLGTTLVAGSAEPAQAQASTDGELFAPMPLVRTVKQADGRERKEPVPLSEYRALRWELGTLAPNASRVVSLRVRIDPPVAAAPSTPPVSSPRP